MGAGHRVLVLLALTFVYLFIGASIFSAIESAHEQKIKLDLFNHLESFVENNPCVNVSDFRDVLLEVWYAASIGVETITGSENGTTPSSSRWDLANAFFFSATVITTIGYGHLSPATSTGQNFCIVYAYLGIPLMAVLLSEISSKWKQRLVNVGLNLNTRLVNVFQHNKLRQAVIALILVIPAYVIVVIIPAAVFSYIEGWDFLVAHYYCFISLSTIGLGDYVATQHDYENKALVWVYKIGTSLYLIAGLGVMAIVFHGVQTKKKRSNHSFSKRFANILRKQKKQWLHVMGEQADRMVDSCPVEAGVISSSVAAAAVAAVASNDTADENGEVPQDDSHIEVDPFGSSSDNDDIDDDFRDLEYLDDIHPSSYYMYNQNKSNTKHGSSVRKSRGFADLADEEEETSFTFLNVGADRGASIYHDPDSDGTEEGQLSKSPINDLDHPKLARKPVPPHRLDLCNFGANKRTNDLTPEVNRSQPQLAVQRDHVGDSKTELRGLSAKKKLWSPSSSLTWEDSGINAASSQSTVDMETTV